MLKILLKPKPKFGYKIVLICFCAVLLILKFIFSVPITVDQKGFIIAVSMFHIAMLTANKSIGKKVATRKTVEGRETVGVEHKNYHHMLKL